MSNPSVYVLAETTVRGMRVCVEDNLGEAIHVHVGDFRLSMSIREFEEMAYQFELAAEELLRLSEISLSMFDRSALDWDWLHRYEDIEKVETDFVRIGDILTKGEDETISSLSRIVKISQSRQYKALCGNDTELRRYKEKNEYGISNLKRLHLVMNIIRLKGYPLDGKMIMVNQYNQIYDGDHRAACLLFLKGEDSFIPVTKLYFRNEKTIEEQKDMEKAQKESHLQKSNGFKPIYRWSESLNRLDMDFAGFKKKLLTFGWKFYTLNQRWHGKQGEIIAENILRTT